MVPLAAGNLLEANVHVVEPGGEKFDAIVCDFLFDPAEMAKPGFDPSDAVDFWDLVNRQDWRICESVQAGMRSQAFRYGYYAPMEDASLDIRRYIASFDKLGMTERKEHD